MRRGNQNPPCACCFYFKKSFTLSRTKGRRLTRCGVYPPVHDNLVSARARAQGFVPHPDKDDSDKTEEETGGRADVPLLEDDAEVGRVPGKEHLIPMMERGQLGLYSRLGADVSMNGYLLVLTLMLHMSPCEGILWPPWPGMSPMLPWSMWE